MLDDANAQDHEQEEFERKLFPLQLEDSNLLNQLWTCAGLNLHENLALLLSNNKLSILKEAEKYQDLAKFLGGNNILEVIHFISQRKIPDENRLILHTATEKGHTFLVRLALDKEPRDNEGFTPLHVAAKHGQMEALTYLSEKSSDIAPKTENGMTPIHLAAQHGQMEALKYLCEKSSDIAPKTNFGLTPLELATHHQQIEAVRMLVSLMELGGNDLEGVVEAITSKNIPHVNRCLHKAAEEGNLLLLKAAINKEPRDEDDLTPLHLAAKYGQIDCLRYISTHGADIDAKTKNGMTPIQFAIDYQQNEAVKSIEFILQFPAAHRSKFD